MPKSPHERGDEEARKTNRGCWIALGVTFALMTGFAIVAVIAVTRIIEDSPIPEWGKRVGEGADIILDGQSNEGASALRSEGCDRAAMFLEVDRVFDLLESLDDAGAFRRPKNAPTHVAVCLVERGGPLPACDDVARAIARKGAPEGDFAVTVTEGSNRGSGQRRCSKRYDRAGKEVGGYDPSTVPIPQ